MKRELLNEKIVEKSSFNMAELSKIGEKRIAFLTKVDFRSAGWRCENISQSSYECLVCSIHAIYWNVIICSYFNGKYNIFNIY